MAASSLDQRVVQAPQGKDAAMSYSIYLALAAATAGPCNRTYKPIETAPDLDDYLEPALQRIRDLVDHYRSRPVTPQEHGSVREGPPWGDPRTGTSHRRMDLQPSRTGRRARPAHRGAFRGQHLSPPGQEDPAT